MEKKKILLSVLPNIILIFIIYLNKAVVSGINTPYGNVLLIFCWVYLFSIFKNTPMDIKDSMKSLAFIATFVYLFIFFGATFGALGVLVLIILMSLFRVYRKKELYLEGMRDIETKIFGKPLDKELWKEEEKQ